MKITAESFTKGSAGHVKVICENAEDTWQLFNLLRVGDHVQAGGDNPFPRPPPRTHTHTPSHTHSLTVT
jgi:hypothetical protein